MPKAAYLPVKAKIVVKNIPMQLNKIRFFMNWRLFAGSKITQVRLVSVSLLSKELLKSVSFEL
jgi:hypothetical protein